jgi:hypothetical protein
MTNLTFPSAEFPGVEFRSAEFRSVAFEVCEAFRAPVEHDEPICAGCGHLADDHERAAATVTPLRRRPDRRLAPVRKAS